MASKLGKGTAHVSKKRWADMSALLKSRFGDTDLTRATILDLQSV
jgi:hypothetical protein